MFSISFAGPGLMLSRRRSANFFSRQPSPARAFNLRRIVLTAPCLCHVFSIENLIIKNVKILFLNSLGLDLPLHLVYTIWFVPTIQLSHRQEACLGTKKPQRWPRFSFLTNYLNYTSWSE